MELGTFAAEADEENGTAVVEARRYLPVVQYSALIFGIPVDALGFLGNFLTIVIVAKTPTLRTPDNLFVISLSISDLLYCCIVLPVILTTYHHNAWVLGESFCRVHPMFMFTFVGATMMSLAGTAFGRYLKITQSPLYAKLFGVKSRSVMMVLFCWLLPLAFILPPATGLWGRLGYEPKTLTCTILRGGSNSGYALFFVVAGLIIPTGIITFCYLQILRTVCKNHKRARKIRSKPEDDSAMISATEISTTVSKKRQQRKVFREDLQYTKMMLCIFIVFIACYLPYMMATLVDPQVKNMTFHFYCGMCVWFSSCLNPIVYVAMNKHFRRAWAGLVPASMPCRQTSEEIG